MVTQSFTLAALLGAMLAVPYAIRASRPSASRLWFGIGLSIAALVYVILAAVRGSSESLWLELGGLALFSAAAWVGVVWFPVVLAAGWALHVAWDLLLHPVHASGYAPWWYPVLCIGFDFFVAGFLVANIAGRRDRRG